MSATLASIRIKNFALVEDLTWSPCRGFNAISGETGAGKSILIGALKLLLGERADRSLIRAGADQCAVEALFETADPRPLDLVLENHGAESCEDGKLIVKRSFSASAGRQFVNGSPCNIALLKELGDLLVDLHGPHDHQSLFSRDEQTRLLDDYAGISETAENYRSLRSRWLSLRKEKETLSTQSQAVAREIELLRHQTEEIAAAELRDGEDEEWNNAHRAASNAKRIREICSSATGLLSEDESSLSSRLGDLGKLLKELLRLDERTAPFESAQIEIIEQIADLSRDIESYADKIDTDPEKLAEIEARLDTIGNLKRKYGNSIREVLDFSQTAHARLKELENMEERGGSLDSEILAAEKSMRSLAENLSQTRAKASKKLAAAVAAQLLELGFRQAEFSIKLDSVPDFGPHGTELAEFVFAPNPGEPSHPLRQIASSGEISRVMLALKCALAAQDRVALLVFDEIDANVGGETATKVGAKMRELGTLRQVLCITHLPQVAASASAHFLVEKKVKEGRTVSLLTPLTAEERENEIARMLGGKSASAHQHAKALLGEPQTR